MAAKVPNVYKAMLQERRPGAASLAHDLQTALDGAAKAMAAGAWQSPTATEFEHALTAQRKTLSTAAASVTHEFDTQIASEPDLVDPNSFQANFARISRMMRY